MAGLPAHAGGPHRHARPAPLAAYRARVAQPPAGIERASRELFLSIGEGEIINLPAGVASIWTSNPAAADVYVNNNHQIHLFGKGGGESTVFATSASGAVIYAAHVVVGQNASSLDNLLRLTFPGTDIHLIQSGQVVILTGTVATPLDVTQAEGYVKAMLNPGTKLGSDDAGKYLIINRLKMATPLQVMLRVRIAEVSRSLSRNLASNFVSLHNSSGFQFGLGQGRTFLGAAASPFDHSIGVGATPVGYGVNGFTTLTNPATGLPIMDPVTGLPKTIPTYGSTQGTTINALSTGTTLGLQYAFGPLSITQALDAGEQAGLVSTLAEPNLAAMSGETAEFLAGGQYPIPVASGLGTVSVDYKNYGVALSYTPTVLANGNISLRVHPEVSELDTSNGVTLNGFSVPGLTVRKAETTVELGSGQSFMIAGLLSNQANHAISKLPGAGDIPILGALFKSTNFQKGETELVIVVTPYLVKPVDDSQIVLPTDGLQQPGELKRAFGGMISDGKSAGALPRPGPTVSPSAPTVSPPAPALSAPAGADATGSPRPAQPRKGADMPNQPGFSLN